MIQIDGYHTSKKDGGSVFLLEHAPFLSQEKGQWLTKGYYFWTDSATFAHVWGRSSYTGGYAITKCLIHLQSFELLDLVGNVGQQEYFEQLVTMYVTRMRLPNGELPTTEDVIAHFRLRAKNHGVDHFPFKAIKIADTPNRCMELRFVGRRSETVRLPTRQQICVFEEAKGCIVEKVGFFPTEYAETSQNIIQARLERKNGCLS